MSWTLAVGLAAVCHVHHRLGMATAGAKTPFGLNGQLVCDACSVTESGTMRQAGTYIKEFVHGDGGRTQPNLAALVGCSGAAEVLTLDVLQVHMDFL